MERDLSMTGALTMRRIAGGCEKAPLSWRIKNFLTHRLPDWPRLVLAYLATWAGVPTLISHLYLKARINGVWVDFGLVSTRVVTDNGATFVVDNLRGNISTITTMKYHGLGTGTNAEAAADTGLQTECTTALNPASTRATGSQTNNGAKVYHTVGTLTFSATTAVTEHGIFGQAATGGGTLLDRSVFSAINVVSGDAIQATYDLTINSGG